MNDVFRALDVLGRLEPDFVSGVSGRGEATRDAGSRANPCVPGVSGVSGEKHIGEKEVAPREGPGEQKELSAQEEALHIGLAFGFVACAVLANQVGLWRWGAQSRGEECANCRHLVMVEEPGASPRRRRFFWRCAKGYCQLETGYRSERIIVAPESCRDFAAWKG